MPLNLDPKTANRAPRTLAKPPAGFLHSVRWMIAVAFLVRVLWILLAHTYKFKTIDNNFSFGWEIGRLGAAIAGGQGFSSPFGGNTGPSAWTAPVYPCIVSLAFRCFGTYSQASAFVLLSVNSLFAALTCWPIVRIARRVFSETVAVWSGWIWALLPYIIFWSVKNIWETSLSAFLTVLLFMLTLEMEGDSRLSSWFGYGLLWGVVGLTNPSALSFLPFSGCWLVWQLYRRKQRFLAPAVLSAVIFWMTMMPWLIRNYEVFHKPVFVRDNFGVELRVGNNWLAEGQYVLALHPSQNPLLYRQYAEMGELAFCARQGELAKQWIRENPGRFLVISFRRVIFFWNGLPRLTKYPQLEQTKNSLFLATSVIGIWGLLLAWRNRVHARFLFASLLIVYPLVYYLCFPEPRYRHPIEPILLILGVYLVSEAHPHEPKTHI